MCDEDRPWITLSHSEKESSLILSLGEQGEPRIWFFEEGSDDPRLGILVDSKGNAAIEFSGRNSDAGITLNVDASGESRISLCNSDNKTPGIRLKLKTNGEGAISLYNEKDEKVWSVSSREEIFPGEDKGQQSK